MDINKIKLPILPFKNTGNISVYLLRLDLLDENISGNKWFKLKYNLEFAKQNGYETILTFGGAYSNHIAATAYACKQFGFKAIGIIRGEMQDNYTIKTALNNNMEMHFVNRALYRDKPQLMQYVQANFGTINPYIIPEGGANELGIKGCTEIVNFIAINFDYICAACGTGTTLAGIVSALTNEQKAIGFSALKNGDFLYDELKKQLHNNTKYTKKYTIISDYHFGGYAKYNNTLIDFMNDFKERYNIELDFIYTAKMLYGIFDLIKKDYFKPQSTVVAVHTGGLQGNNSIQNKNN